MVFIVLRIWGTLRFVINAHFVSDADSNAMAWIVPLQVRVLSDRRDRDHFCKLGKMSFVELKKFTSSLCNKTQQV